MSEGLWHSHESNFIAITQVTIRYEEVAFDITTTFTKGQCVESWRIEVS